MGFDSATHSPRLGSQSIGHPSKTLYWHPHAGDYVRTGTTASRTSSALSISGPSKVGLGAMQAAINSGSLSRLI